MQDEPGPLRLLLDEHYPPWLSEVLRGRGVNAVAIKGDRPDLIGATDVEVLAAAVGEGRAVVTEDVNTFGLAVREVPGHVGVVFCLSKRWPRDAVGLPRLADALAGLVTNPPQGLGSAPIEWWLE